MNTETNLLLPIDRQENRKAIQIEGSLPFYGIDIWNAYELSWLNTRGKPCVGLAEFIFPCTSAKLIESKSFKLYLNAFSDKRFNSIDAYKETLYKDLTAASGAPVFIKIATPNQLHQHRLLNFNGTCIDDLDIAIEKFEVQPDFLRASGQTVTETVYSNLLKSNCPITSQPDWASIQITYTGKKIDHADLLRYIISFRHHNEFHEHCVERIFTDIMRQCAPEKLTVYARYTRRGGLDINPYRSTEDTLPKNNRDVRQ